MVEEEHYHRGAGQGIEFPLHLRAEGGGFRAGRDALVPGAAAGVQQRHRQVAQVVREERLPLDGGAHFDAAGGEDGEVSEDGGVRGEAVFEVGMRVEGEVVDGGRELAPGVGHVAVDVCGAPFWG